MGCLKLPDWLRNESAYMPKITQAMICLWNCLVIIESQRRDQEPENKTNLSTTERKKVQFGIGMFKEGIHCSNSF